VKPWVAGFVAMWTMGCSFLNAPNRNLTPPDGGVDGGGIELFCSDGLDDDNDMAVDCEDTDCSEEPACCERRRTTLSYDWTGADLSDAWSFTPTTWSPLRPSFGGTTFVGGFVPTDTPRALVSLDCVSLGLGGWVATTLHATDSGGCSASETCDDYAGVVLTAVTDSTPGSRLQDEIAVTLHAGGLVLVTQAGTEVARATAGVEQDVEVEIEVRPMLDESNRPTLIAAVTVDGDIVLEDFTVTLTENLISTGDCAEIPGLHVAAEGQGDLVYVGPVEAAKQDCANPSQFDEQSATLRAENLEFNPSWVEAYVGSPTLASSRNSLSDVQWDLIAEGSNWSPELEPTTHVGYALGHARIATDEGGNWRLTGWESSQTPKVGDDPPACAEAACADNRSVREPHLLAELNEDRELRDLTLAFARELVTVPTERDLFGIQMVRPVGAPSTPVALPSTPTVSPDDIPECISLRDPAIIPVDPEAIGGYWVLFTCVESAMPPRQIYAVRISRALEVVQEGGEAMRRVVLDADELGPFAASGIRAPEPVIAFAEDGLRVRIWFLAQSVPGAWAVALAEARTHDTELLEFDFPEPLPFPVNPILSDESTLVRSGCIGEECNITGIAVTPRADDPSRLRFLLARRLKVSGGDDTYQLIPLEQTWRTP
jgi:hypothetical protein